MTTLARKLMTQSLPPVVVSQTANNGGSSSSSSPTITMPASIVAGNLLIAALAHRGANSFTWPAGWTEITDTVTAPALTIGWRIADGSEGGSITLTASGSSIFAGACIQLANWKGTPEAGTHASGSSTAPNPPNLAPSWGADAGLAIALCSSRATSNISGYPSGYGNTQQSRATSDTSIGTATKEISAASEDPGTFTTTNHAWAAQTVIVRGA